MRRKRLIGTLVVVLGMALAACSASAPQRAAQTSAHTGHRVSAPRTTAARRVGHVFVINLENKGFTRTWGAHSQAPYLARTLRAKGVLLTRYYGTAHYSEPNYIAQVSGQGPNPQMQGDCPVFDNLRTVRVAAYDQRVGQGCVFGASTPTIMGQLDGAHRTWRGYMQDMDRACQHPAVGARDPNRKATPGHEYATRHDPFVYFHSVIDRPSYCRSHVVTMSHLRTDLASVSTTRNLSYLTPDLCDDGHDSPCADGRPGGLVSADVWLRRTVPMILASPAFRRDGVLVITADESDGPSSDSTACCGEGASANTPRPGIDGPGGGRIGALVISRWTRAGSTSARTYNHYGLFGSIEQAFGLRLKGYARLPHQHLFGADVYNR